MNLTLALVAVVALSGTPKFQRHDIDDFPGGYQATVTDVNGDGRIDVLVLSIGGNNVVWYENPGSPEAKWKQHPIAKTTLDIDMAPHDIDGDGKPEIALAYGFYFGDGDKGGDLHWLKPQSDFNLPWQSHPIAVDPVTHRVRWGDLDGDGRMELVHAPFFGPGSKGIAKPTPCHLWAFRIPAHPATDTWPAWKIDETLTGMHGVYVADIDNDGRAEVVTASFEGIHRFDWEGQGSSAQWKKLHVSPGAAAGNPNDVNSPRGSSEVAFGQLTADRKHPFYAAIEPWHGNQLVVYTSPEKEGFWNRRVLNSTLEQGHGLAVADLDGDGQSEIVYGWRGATNHGVAIYDPDATGENFTKIDLDPTMPADCTLVADINGDGKPDLVVVGGNANKVAWYENVMGK